MACRRCIASTKLSQLTMFIVILLRSSSSSKVAADVTDIKSVLLSNKLKNNMIAFNFVHRDAPRSPLRDEEFATESLDQNPFKDVIHHVQAQQVRINSAKPHHHHRHHRHHHHHHHHHHKAVSGIRNPVVTLGQAGLEYYMTIQVGTPPTEVILIMDTGSDVSWIQSVPCKDCVPALRPPFNPRHSSSFFKLPCKSSTCKTVYQGVKPFCSDSAKTCLFSTRYADGSLSSGLLALETISTNTSDRMPTGASGLLGMDRRPISFPSQLSSRYGQKFSHCFPDKISHLNSSGVIFFGDSEMSPQNLRYTPLIENKVVPSASLDYYYLSLLGVSVNKFRLPLQKPAFDALRRQFLRRASHLNRVDDTSGFTPCYNFTNGAYESARVPSITL